MKELVEKFIELEKKLSQKKGDFTLFALFLPEDGFEWDFVVAAPWIEADREAALRYIASQLQAILQPDELIRLSKVVLIKQNNPGLEEVNEAIKTEHAIVEFKDRNFFGLEIKHAYVITSQNAKRQRGSAGHLVTRVSSRRRRHHRAS